jgi:hypothetical protein
MPTRLHNGEGRAGQGSNRHEHLFRSAGVRGHGTPEGCSGNRGRPALDGGCGSNAVFGRRSGRESDRAMVPLRPGNAGGGKGPDFSCAIEDGEGR